MGVLLLGGVLATCSGSSRLASRDRRSSSAAEPTARSAGAPTTVTAVRAVYSRFEVTTIPGLSNARRVVRGRRAEWTAAGGWEFSRDRLHGELAAAVEADGRWVFVSSDGLVATSERFVGPLRRVGALRHPLSAYPWTRGRVAIANEDGLWTTDGRSLDHAGDPPVPVSEVVFSDTREGLAATTEGGLLLTHDGGATWVPVDVGAHAVLSVRVVRQQRSARTTREALQVGVDGTVAPLTPPTTEAPREQPEDGLLDEWGARFPAEYWDEPSRPRGGLLRDGSRLELDGEELVHRDARGLELGRRHVGGDCRLGGRWGAAVVVHCNPTMRTEDGEFVLRDRRWRTEDGESLEVIVMPATVPVTVPGGHEVPGVMFSDDGVHAVMSACHRELLAHTEEGWRSIALPPIPDSEAWTITGERGEDLVGLHADKALLWRTSAGHRIHIVADFTRGTVSPVEAAPVPGVETVLGPLGWTRDGLLLGLLTERVARDGNVWIAVGRPGERLSVRTAPRGTMRVAFADARRGIAIGPHGGALWRTLDGGGRWEELPVPFDRSADAPRYGNPPSASCDESECTVGASDGGCGYVLRVSGWGPIQRGEDPIVLGSAAPEPPTPQATSPHAYLAPIRCSTAGPTLPSPFRLAPGSPVVVHPWLEGVVRVERSSPPASSERISLAGLDGRYGPERIVSPRIFSGHGVVGRGRGVALLVGGSEAFLAGVDAASPFLERLRLVAPVSAHRGQGWIALPTQDGGLVAYTPLRFDARELEFHERRIDAVVEVDARGAFQALRTFPVNEGDSLLTGLASVRGRWGAVYVARDSTLRVAAVSGRADMTGLPTRLPDALTPCADPTPSDAATLYFTGESAALSVRYEADFRFNFGSRTRVAIELSSRGACVRSVSSTGQPEERWAGGREMLVSLHAEGGRLVGLGDNLRVRVPLRCEVP